MSLNDLERYVLSYYRACELAGAVLFGKLALHTTIDAIRVPLTEHCLEEAQHAWLWTRTIRDLGSTPLRVTATYQSEYGREFGLPRNTLEILCLTQVFERRTLDHFNRHLARSGTHPLVQAALRQMIADESGHLSWVRRELDLHSAAHGEASVEEIMARLQAIDQRVYDRLMRTPALQEFFQVGV